MTIPDVDLKQSLLEHALNDEAGNEKNGDSGKLSIPVINDWEMKTKGQALYITGKIRAHACAQKEGYIKTSAILSYRRVQDRLLVLTRNSIYELGEASISQRLNQERAKEDLKDESLRLKQERSQKNLKSKYFRTLPDPWILTDEDVDLTILQ